MATSHGTPAARADGDQHAQDGWLRVSKRGVRNTSHGRSRSVLGVAGSCKAPSEDRSNGIQSYRLSGAGNGPEAKIACIVIATLAKDYQSKNKERQLNLLERRLNLESPQQITANKGIVDDSNIPDPKISATATN